MSVQQSTRRATGQRGLWRRLTATFAAIVAVVLGAAAGAAIGLSVLGSTVVAESRLVVGDQSVRAQSVPGYALATQQLAATYARLLGATEDEGVSASPIPDSAIIRVQAQGPDEASAVTAADEAAARLIKTANQARSAAEDQASSDAYLRARERLRVAQTRATAAADGSRARAGAADDQVELAQVRVDAAAEALREDVRASLSNNAGVSVVQRAVATPDALPRAGLLGGVAGGAGVALLIAAGVVIARERR